PFGRAERALCGAARGARVPDPQGGHPAGRQRAGALGRRRGREALPRGVSGRGGIAVAARPLPGEADAYEHIQLETGGPVAVVTMNRPHKRNALSLAHMRELIRALRGIAQAGEAAVVILRGAGPAFCAGHDLSEMVGAEPAFYRELFDTCTELMDTIQSIPQPVIAQVHGVATAAGCQLAATCDVVVAGASAQFATPGVKIGLFCSTPMVALSRAVGR